MGKTVDSVESMSLLCNVQAQPQASVVIYKEDKMGGRQVFYSDNHNNSMVGIIHDPGHDITMYQLELEELDASKFGNYYCAADNMLGVDSDTVKISGGTKNLEAKTSIMLQTVLPHSSRFVVKQKFHLKILLASVFNCYEGRKTINTETRPFVIALLQNFKHKSEVVTNILGWPSITSVRISPAPAKSLCYRVSVSLQSDTPVLSVRFSYSHNLGTVNLVPSQEVTSHR